MAKSLILEFRSAKLFRSANRDINVLHGGATGTIARKGSKYFVEPITFYQISNMLHTLFGERPAPSLRSSIFKRMKYYDEMAKNSLLMIENVPIDGKFQEEMLQLNKATWESNRKDNIIITWEIIKDFLNVNYPWLVKQLKSFGIKNPLKLKFTECINHIRSLRDKNPTITDDFFNELDKMKCSGLISFVKDKDNAFEITRTSRLKTKRLVNIRGINTVTKLNGRIIVPVNDNDIGRLSTSMCPATILDGGLIKIIDVVDSNEISSDGFILVSTISTRKKNYEN